MVLHTMVELIHTLLCIRTKRLLCFFYPQLILGNILKHFNEFAANDKKTPPNNDSCDAQTNGIKLKDVVYIATTSAAAALCDNSDALYYTILCRDMCFINNDPMPHILHSVVTNLFAGI